VTSVTSAPFGHQALFDDVVAVATRAHAATAGWRAICVRAQRTVGKAVVQPLSELDLGEEIPALAGRVRKIVQSAPTEVDTLVFGLFDGIDDDGAGVYAGFHVAGATGFDPSTRWLMASPGWVPHDRFAVAYALRFGAAALLSRFATEGLPHRIVVAFDEGDFAEIRGR